MEPYVLTRVTISNNLMKLEPKARTRGDASKLLAYVSRSLRNLVHWYVRTSIASAERISEKRNICY